MEIVKKNRPRNLGDEDVGVLGEIIIEEPEQLNSSQYQKRNTYLPESKLFEPIGILDPEGKNVNPLTGEPYKNIYFKDPNKEFSLDNATYDWFAMNPKGWAGFPMYKEPKEKALKAFYNNQVTLIISGTGSGKTVLSPKYLLHVLNYQGRIAITNPKKIPSEENAIYAAKTLDVKLGEQVGLKYRNSPKEYYSKDSKLVYCTDGYVSAKLMGDPMLLDFDAVVIDEAHERGIQIDLLLFLLKQTLKLRPDFKLVIMSATVNEKIFIDYFPGLVVVDGGGSPPYPIEEFYLKEKINKFDENGNLVNDAYIGSAIERVVEILRNTESGDILVFFPGKGECQEGCMNLHNKLAEVNKNLDNKIYCNILHGSTDAETKSLVINNKKYKNINNGRYERKVIFATEVAESSITIKGIEYVVDSGLANESIFYSEKDLHSLEQKYISKASHRQRKGRTGRIGPGTCYNLFTKEEFEKVFPDYRKAPILQDDISAELLIFTANPEFVSHIDFPFKYPSKNKNKVGGENIIVNKKNIVISNNKRNKEIKTLEVTEVKLKGQSLNLFLNQMIERPQEDKIKRTLERFIALGAIKIENNVGKITDMGKAMACFRIKPEIGRMLIAGYNYHCREDMVNLAGMMDISEFRMDAIFERFSSKSKDQDQKKKEKSAYDKVKKKWANSLGDHFSLIDIYNEFKLRMYDTYNRRTDRLIKEKKPDQEVREWCKANYLNYRNLSSVKRIGKKLDERFREVLDIFHEKHPNEKPTHLFIDNVPIISEKKDENVMRALVEGFYINIIKKTGDFRYTDCFPETKMSAGLTQDSLYAMIKSPTKYALYSEFKSIFGRANFAMVSKIPPKLVEQIQNSSKAKPLESCWKKMEDESKKHHKKQGKKKHHK